MPAFFNYYIAKKKSCLPPGPESMFQLTEH